MIATLIALLLAAEAPHPAPHPNSWSRTQVEVRGERLVLRSELQHQSLLEVLPALDPDGDGLIAQTELDSARSDVEDYLLSHYVFWTGTTPEPGSGARIPGRLSSARTVLAPDVFEPDLVVVVAEHAAPAPIADLRIEMLLFTEVPDDHIDSCRVDWNGLDRIELAFSDSYPAWRLPAELAPRRRGPLAFALRGARDAARAWGTLGLVLALALAARSRRSLCGVAAWTAAAVPAGFLLGAGGVLPLEPRFVELVAALSVAYVAATNVLSRGIRRLWPEAALFGLVEGAASGVALAAAPEFEEFAFEAPRAAALAAYALPGGLVAAALALALGVLHRLPGLERVRLAASAALLIAGLVAFAQRAGWLPAGPG